MRTIVDVVNVMRGDWSTGSDCLRDPDVFRFSRHLSAEDKWVELAFTDGQLVNVEQRDFDQCVKEMSEGEFVPEASKMKTVTDKDGNVYETGKVYEFSDSGEADEWTAHQLVKLDEVSEFPFETSITFFKYCRENQAENGTITKAPVELVDGAVYKFSYRDKDARRITVNILAFYNGSDDVFSINGSSWVTDGCTNITRLVPEVK